MTRIKAISLFSGGLDSILATQLILNQGIEVIAFNVKTPFGIPKKDGVSEAEAAIKQLNIPLKIVTVDKEYIRMLRNPKHGYGKNINPCIDCKIFIIKQAIKYAKEISADFLFTGEVLGERPMSQHGPALRTIEEEAGLKGKLLRPLSAKLLPETIAERKGLVNRSKLMDISGRSRKAQFQLAKEFGITTYPSPAGGCLLTCEEYSKKLDDLFEHKKNVSGADVTLLRFGRHFRLGENKIIVGRNETENKFLMSRKNKSEYYFELPDIVGPVTILQGAKTKKAIQVTAQLTAFYSDAKREKVKVNYGKDALDKSIEVMIPNRDEVDNLRVGKKIVTQH
ncbi:MAG: tRNA 4-thiouridine(8) synthase ThiI [Candidatus Bathyarchaeota archaeon]|nr:tRNA 4-thiouridine(8) synthase ThiI [Candidatus Termiticorpusculum sp.]